jgi:hypothetical protein
LRRWIFLTCDGWHVTGWGAIDHGCVSEPSPTPCVVRELTRARDALEAQRRRCRGWPWARSTASPFSTSFHETSIQEARAALADEAFDWQLATGAATPTDDFYEMIVRDVEELLVGTSAD